MDRRQLLRYYLAAVVGSLVVFTVAYDVGMSAFEGRPRTLLESFEVVLQTFTTTGYGQDAPWSSTPVTLLVVGMQVASLVLIFAAFPTVIVPLVEDALSTSPPTERSGLVDHVVVCGASPRTRTVIEEFDDRDVDYVLVESDRETATDLHDRGRPVVHADPERAGTLRRVGLPDARALIADGPDQVDLSVLMAAREVAPDVPAHTVVEDESMAPYHEHAGADRTFSPRELLGRGLANKVRTGVEWAADGVGPGSGTGGGAAATGRRGRRGGSVGAGLVARELSIRPTSALVGRTLAESGVDDRPGVHVVGAWSRGEFRTPPLGDLRLDQHTVLLVIGGRAAVRALSERGPGALRRHDRGTASVVVAGHGVVGSTVVDALARADAPEPTVVDLDDDPAVDVVGDVTETTTLRRAGVDDADTVVLALDDDATALLATFVVRELTDDAELVVRSERAASVRKLYRAGADYVLSLASVTGRLLAGAVLDGRDVVSPDEPVRVVRVPAAPVAGRRLDDLDARAAAGCTVVAVERRDGRIDADVATTVPGERDHLLVAGLASRVERLRASVADGEWPGTADDGDATTPSARDDQAGS